MSTSGKRLLSHLFLSISERSSFSHILRHTNGHSKWSATVDRRPISCFSLMDIQDKRWEGTGYNESLTRYKPLHTSWRQLFPQIPPFFPCTCLLTRSLYLVSSHCCSKESISARRSLSRAQKRRIHLPFLAHFKENVCHLLSLFVLSSTCLIVRTKRVIELMNVLCCYYLLACACMDLLFLCLGRERDGGDGIPGLKKKKKKKKKD